MDRKTLIIICLLLICAFCENAFAATYNVSTTGTKTSGSSTVDNWTNSNCYGTIGAALNAANSAGDEIIVNDGTYYNLENFINDREYSIPNGINSSIPTIIRARNKLAVRLKNSGSLNYYDSLVYLTGSFIKIDGFILDVVNSNDPASICYIGGTYNRVTNCIAIRRGVADNYSSWFSLMGSYNLVEDCAGAGHTRYGFESGSADGTTHHNVFRRCVGRADYSDSDQPMATFNFYGNSNGNYNAEYVAFQNCIAVDGHMMRTGNGTYAYAWGGFYFPHAVKDAILRGCIVLNVDCLQGAYCPKEESAYNITMTDCVAWDTKNSWNSNGDYGFDLRGNGNGVTVDHCTFGASYRGIYNNSGSSSGNSITNTLFMQNTQIGTPGNWNTQNKNGFNPSAQAFGNNPVLSTDTLAYLCRIESGTAFDGAASDGGDIGATIEKKHGASGTFWGQTGWDTLTSDDLWPWANEDKIREVFREANNPNSGSTPSNNDTTRGFCADGQTLTKYIWEYLGNTIPPEIYAGGALSILTSSLSDGTISSAYTQTLSATGGTSPYTWAVTSGSLPSGLVLNASTGVISGTPTTQVTSNFTVQVTDAALDTQPKALSITVNAPDLTAPAISLVDSSGITDAAAVITWTTNEVSTSQVEYGITSGYGSQTTLDTALVTSHSVTLSGLSTNTAYHFRVKSKDSSNNEGISNDYTFTTLNCVTYTSSSPAVTLTGTTPEEGSMTVSITNSLSQAASAELILNVFDPDLSGEGYIYVNENDAIELPTSGEYDNQTVDLAPITISTSWLAQGGNTVRFTHVSTVGYQVNTMAVRVYFAGSSDSTAPAAVNDLSASTGSSDGQINLTWTATGDDGSTGTAASYIIKYSTANITNNSLFDAAADVSGEPPPGTAGTAESMTVSGLTPGQMYYFAMKAADEVPNNSSLSNSTNAEAKETIIIPDTTPPYTTGQTPANGATGIAKDTDIVLHVKDDGAGVDINTIIMKINGAVVTPVITGTPADYTLTYSPGSEFENGEVVNVSVEASDLAP